MAAADEIIQKEVIFGKPKIVWSVLRLKGVSVAASSVDIGTLVQ